MDRSLGRTDLGLSCAQMTRMFWEQSLKEMSGKGQLRTPILNERKDRNNGRGTIRFEYVT